MFSVCPNKTGELVTTALTKGIEYFFVLSTCNRTEIFGFARSAQQLSSVLCSVTEGSEEDFARLCYTKNDMQAVRHLFEVSAGLDSQILGDYEITGQIKQSIKLSKAAGCMNATLERLVNESLQASKKIRTDTALSSGTVSVSFAAVQSIQQKVQPCIGKKILLVGTGKMGTNSCKNLVDYLPGNNIMVMNRTEDKAAKLALQLGISFTPFSDVAVEVGKADIVIVTTHCHEPVIDKSMLTGNKAQLFIDLSVPANIHSNVSDVCGVSLLTVDDLSKIKDETLQIRQAEIPKAIAIIEDRIAELHQWCLRRKYAPVLKAARLHLQQLNMTISTTSCASDLPSFSQASIAAEDKIQKAINGMAVKMQADHLPGCHCISAINEFISLS